jgi:hypothetical protein
MVRIMTTFGGKPENGRLALALNPAQIIAQSPYAAFQSVWTKCRVVSYTVKVYFSPTSTSTAGQYAAWLCKDTVAQQALSYQLILSQPRSRSRKMYQNFSARWQPMEPQDFNFADWGNIKDDGILYVARGEADDTLNVNVDITMNLRVYAATFAGFRQDPLAPRVLSVREFTHQQSVSDADSLPSSFESISLTPREEEMIENLPGTCPSFCENVGRSYYNSVTEAYRSLKRGNVPKDQEVREKGPAPVPPAIPRKTWPKTATDSPLNCPQTSGTLHQ